MAYNDIQTTEANLLNQLKHRTPGYVKPQLLRDLVYTMFREDEDVTTAYTTAIADETRNYTFSAAAGGANVCEVTITAKDGNGDTVTGVQNLNLWLSDAATGAGLTGTTASGTVQAKAASGTALTVQTAKKHLNEQTLASGVYILEITDAAKTGFYVCVQNPDGSISVSDQLETADYGS